MDKGDTMRSIPEIVNELPKPTGSEREILRLFFEPRATAHELIRAMEKNAPMARQILVVANSDYFQGRFKASSLPQAVAKMSLPFAKKWACIHTLYSYTLRNVDSNHILPEEWQKALCTASAAELYADYFAAAPPHKAFVAGFVCDIGLPYLRQFSPTREMPRLLTTESTRECLLKERDSCDFDHRQLGAALLGHLGVPIDFVRELFPQDPDSEEGSPSELRRLMAIGDAYSRFLLSEAPLHMQYHALAEELYNLDHEAANDLAVAVMGEVLGVIEGVIVDSDAKAALIDMLQVIRRRQESLFATTLEKDSLAPFSALPDFASVDMTEQATQRVMEAVAHEVRNPLMAVGGFARRLVEAMDPASKEREYAQIILDEGLRLEKALGRMGATER